MELRNIIEIVETIKKEPEIDCYAEKFIHVLSTTPERWKVLDMMLDFGHRIHKPADFFQKKKL